MPITLIIVQRLIKMEHFRVDDSNKSIHVQAFLHSVQQLNQAVNKCRKLLQRMYIHVDNSECFELSLNFKHFPPYIKNGKQKWEDGGVTGYILRKDATDMLKKKKSHYSLSVSKAKTQTYNKNKHNNYTTSHHKIQGVRCKCRVSLMVKQKQQTKDQKTLQPKPH